MRSADGAPRPGETLGVEEEFFVIDPATRLPVARADALVDDAGTVGLSAAAELTPMQFEVVTPVCRTVPEIALSLRRQRALAGRLAANHGLALAATGTPALGTTPPPPVRKGGRYERMADHFGALLDEQGTCGLHVHVGVADLDLAVRVCTRLRPSLAILLAISANSPFHAGMDTGHDSWRAVLSSRWPTVTAPPRLLDSAQYHDEVERLHRYGLASEESGIYWLARPSRRFPTVEVRVADTQPTVADTLLLVVVIRALVCEAVMATQREDPFPAHDDTYIRAALWAAARNGLSDTCARTDPALVTNVEAVERLVSRLRPHLEENGDWRTVTSLVRRLRHLGGGAHRQRAVHHRTTSLEAVVDSTLLADEPTDGL
ncbi:YbdK family carboxylate-amine ligase [Actinosynnema sp. NPDC002837]